MAYHNGNGRVLDRVRGVAPFAREPGPGPGPGPGARPGAAIAADIASQSPTRGAAMRSRSAFPELDCVSDRLPPETLAEAKRRAVQVGVGAERVLIAAGLIEEDSYLVALAQWL